MHIKPFAKFVVAGAAALAVIAPAAVGEAGGRPQVDFAGTGTYEMTQFDLFARGSGDVDGKPPFDGTVTFMLRTDDGSFPVPGECEPGFANFAVQGRGRTELWGTSAGDVCGEFVSESSAVSVVYTGDYSIVESSPRLHDTEGWIEIRLATGNRMAVTLFDS